MTIIYIKGKQYTNQHPVPKGEYRKIYKDKKGKYIILKGNKKRLKRRK